MKKYLLLLFLSSFVLLGSAQEKTNAQPTNTPKLFKQPDLEKFYGTWTYEKNGVYFSITLDKSVFTNPDKNSMEFLQGNHVFKQNGKIVDDKGTEDNSANSIGGGNFVSANRCLISFRFREYNRGVFSSGTMEYIDGSTPSLIWKLNRNEKRRGIILPGEENLKDPEFIVPTDIILRKVK